ncbi:cupin domain-containing protein [Shewanella sp. SM101]|uniref:cupin domain-containing protein n=1 Tax=unclassified Shewanella TaxID=196818 RepID=UPI0021DB495A|nr:MULTISPECIES: cupin domain-containing protein [unclassified Shewanella]MCU7996853.1 cupin domain-containing protein [Shewanella sp. SM95]MCU8106828.1 cupin domain-containing protein [Shewanella sp. SM101]
MTVSINAIIRFAAAQTPVETYQLPTEKLLAGNPTQGLENHYSSPCDQFHSGIWQSESGAWKINYTEYEYCEILEGMSVITDLQGQSQTFTVGDRFIIPAGFQGTWEVVEPCRKVYVIYEQK